MDTPFNPETSSNSEEYLVERFFGNKHWENWGSYDTEEEAIARFNDVRLTCSGFFRITFRFIKKTLIRANYDKRGIVE